MKIVIGIVASLVISLISTTSVSAVETAASGEDSTGTHTHDSAHAIDVTPIEYVDAYDNDEPLLGYVSIPQSVLDSSEQVPAVLILPAWGNIDDYVKIRATMIANEFNWIGFTADIYGKELHDVQDFNEKVELSTPFRSSHELFNGRIQAAIDTLKEHPNVDSTNIAIIGYCMGGSGVLSYSFADTTNTNTTSDIVGAVSFHGGLLDFDVQGPMANPVLVLSGGNDDTGTAVEELESKLVEADSTWQITRYSGIDHGFTVFGAPAYNEWVDERSWNEMSTFLKEVFGIIEYGTTPPIEDIDYYVTESDSDGAMTAVERMSMNDTDVIDTDATTVAVETIVYDDNGFPLMGYLAMPIDADDGGGKQYPAVVILPDWDGVNEPNGYEAQRAVMMATQREESPEQQYIAMVADIYGVEYTSVDDYDTKLELATKYRSDPALFVSRIQAAINIVIDHPSVDNNNIFVAGYCLGGSGAIDYAFADHSAFTFDGVKAVVPIHGGLNPLSAIQTTDTVKQHILVLSGGVDDAHGNTTELEMHLDSTGATWEVTRYSNAEHGFTMWGSDVYQDMADSRSWWSMMSLFDALSTTTTMDGDGDEVAVMVNDGDHDDHDDHDHDHDDHDDHDSSASSFGPSIIVATAAAVATMAVGLL